MLIPCKWLSSATEHLLQSSHSAVSALYACQQNWCIFLKWHLIFAYFELNTCFIFLKRFCLWWQTNICYQHFTFLAYCSGPTHKTFSITWLPWRHSFPNTYNLGGWIRKAILFLVSQGAELCLGEVSLPGLWRLVGTLYVTASYVSAL